MKRIFCAVLAAFLLLGAFASCTEQPAMHPDAPMEELPAYTFIVSGWSGDAISKAQLLGDVAAENVESIVFTADKDGAWVGYNNTASDWTQGETAATVTVSATEIDFSDNFNMLIGAAEVTTVTWVINEK